jgi:TATA-binding protein-associated factor
VDTAQSNTLSLAAMIEVRDGYWPWEGCIRVLEVDLFDPSWTTRHGAACAIRDILKPQGSSAGMSNKLTDRDNQLAHERWCNDLAAKILCILVLDRFCDFSSDQSVSPVRESVAQTLASLFMHMPRRSLSTTHEILLKMARQEFCSEDEGMPYVWQVRHGGMLGLKYEVAVRKDLFVMDTKEEEEELFDETLNTEVSQNTEFLRSVVSTAILG